MFTREVSAYGVCRAYKREAYLDNVGVASTKVACGCTVRWCS